LLRALSPSISSCTFKFFIYCEHWANL
jgi:hypothetical protein